MTMNKLNFNIDNDDQALLDALLAETAYNKTDLLRRGIRLQYALTKYLTDTSLDVANRNNTLLLADIEKVIEQVIEN